MRRAWIILWAGVVFVTLEACDRLPFGGLEIVAQGDRLFLSGEINRSAPRRIAAALADRPGTTTIVLDFVPGVTNLGTRRKLVAMIRGRGLRTVVPPGGLVAAGGTDLFLAGATRLAAPDACIGVHGWAAGMFGVEEGRYLPRDDPAHIPYRALYSDLGLNDKFYWFSINAASSDGMYWMRGIEINHFNLSDRRVPQRGSGAEVDHRCWARSRR